MVGKTYAVHFMDGWSANSHFGREIAARLKVNGQPQEFASLTEARAALRDARRLHGGGGLGRFDILDSQGHRWSWE